VNWRSNFPGRISMAGVEGVALGRGTILVRLGVIYAPWAGGTARTISIPTKLLTSLSSLHSSIVHRRLGRVGRGDCRVRQRWARYHLFDSYRQLVTWVNSGWSSRVDRVRTGSFARPIRYSRTTSIPHSSSRSSGRTHCRFSWTYLPGRLPMLPICR